MRHGSGRAEGASLRAVLGAGRAVARPGSRFTRRQHRLRAGLVQLLFVAVGLVGGIFMPKITVSPLLSSGKIVDLLFTAGATVISLVLVVYSLLFLVVEWVSGAFSMRLALFRDDPIVWRTFGYSIGLFVFCFTAALAIGNDEKVSIVVPALALALIVGALALIRVLQTRAFVAMLLAPTLTAVTERGRELLEGLYPSVPAARKAVDLPPPVRTVTWPGHPAVLQQLNVEPLVGSASAAGSVVVFRQTVGATLLAGLPVADVHGGDLGPDAVLRAVVTGTERNFDQDPLLAFRLLADIALRALSPAVNDPATAVQVVDSLEGLLSLLAGRAGRADQVTDEAGEVRVVLHLPRWADFARGCLDDLIGAAADSPLVLLRLRDLLARLGGQVPPSGAGIVAARAAWVDDSLARKFPVIWADTAGGTAADTGTATAGRGQLAAQPSAPGQSRGRRG